jgi:hypothetical protein
MDVQFGDLEAMEQMGMRDRDGHIVGVRVRLTPEQAAGKTCEQRVCYGLRMLPSGLGIDLPSNLWHSCRRGVGIGDGIVVSQKQVWVNWP